MPEVNSNCFPCSTTYDLMLTRRKRKREKEGERGGKREKEGERERKRGKEYLSLASIIWFLKL